MLSVMPLVREAQNHVIQWTASMFTKIVVFPCL